MEYHHFSRGTHRCAAVCSVVADVPIVPVKAALDHADRGVRSIGLHEDQSIFPRIRMQAFFRIVLPQAVTGIAATTVFCLIFSWNEYAFALMLTSETARTAPPSIATMLGRGGIEWSAIAVGSLGFLIPVIIVVFLLRNYLLRGVTFGAVRK